MESHRAAIISAEENLRVVNKKYEVSTATSVEVLDVQGSLTQAKGNYSVSVFDYYIAWANLQRASGGAF
jgi:outer membrane protein TolC